MRSELIDEIFTVESEAEKIVKEAQVEGRARVAEAQKTGENRLKSAIEQARRERDAAITEAQQQSDRRIAAVREALVESDRDNQEFIACAEQIANRMVTILCRSSVGESNP